MSNVPVIVTEELLPCPFCGGDKARTIHIRDGRKVACICGACGKPEFHGPQDRPGAEARAVAAWNTRIAATSTLQDQVEALEWFSSQHRLSIEFYSPMYGDDDDQSEEWRVHKESGPINDRGWDVVGTGATAAIAIASARAALTQKDISR